MGDSDARITRIEMPDGTEVWARISGAEELAQSGSGPSFTDIGAGNIADRVQARVESLQGVVTSVARSLAEPLRAVRPDEVSVEFGIELTAKSGKVVGLLADGEAKGSIKVTLTWNGGGPPSTRRRPRSRPHRPARPPPCLPHRCPPPRPSHRRPSRRRRPPARSPPIRPPGHPPAHRRTRAAAGRTTEADRDAAAGRGRVAGAERRGIRADEPREGRHRAHPSSGARVCP